MGYTTQTLMRINLNSVVLNSDNEKDLRTNLKKKEQVNQIFENEYEYYKFSYLADERQLKYM